MQLRSWHSEEFEDYFGQFVCYLQIYPVTPVISWSTISQKIKSCGSWNTKKKHHFKSTCQIFAEFETIQSFFKPLKMYQGSHQIIELKHNVLQSFLSWETLSRGSVYHQWNLAQIRQPFSNPPHEPPWVAHISSNPDPFYKPSLPATQPIEEVGFIPFIHGDSWKRC